jgi:hypothetical protein
VKGKETIETGTSKEEGMKKRRMTDISAPGYIKWRSEVSREYSRPN